jgi:hypothetical protein
MNLTIKDKQLWDRVFIKAKATHPDTTASKIAWAAINKTVVIAKGRLSKKYELVAKSGYSNKKVYMAELIFGSTNKDLDNDSIPRSSLVTKLNGLEADIEHSNLWNRDEFDKQWLFKVQESFFNDDKLMGLVTFNPEHAQFSQVWENIYDFGASLEYDTSNGYEIVGLTGTFDPRNTDARIISKIEM